MPILVPAGRPNGPVASSCERGERPGTPTPGRHRNPYVAGPPPPAMADTAETLRESPVDFSTAVAYALHPEMRRLIILYVVGTVLLPVGFQGLIGPGVTGVASLRLFESVLGVLGVIVGATLLFAGLVGAIFKLVTDANRLAVAE